MINNDLLALDIADLKKIWKNKISDYGIISELKILLKTYKENLIKIEKLRSQRNQVNTDIKQLTNNKNQISSQYEQVLFLKNKSKKIKTAINNLNIDFSKLKKEIDRLNLTIPNFPEENVPYGTSEKNNPEIKK